MTLLEVMISIVVVSTLLLASAGAFTTSIRNVNSSQDQSRGAVFLTTVLEDVSAQSYENLPAFNGDQYYDHGTAAESKFRVDLTVFLASVDLQQVQATLVDLRTNRVLGRVTTLRARR